MAQFSRLLSPGQLGSIKLKNRLLQTAIGSNLAGRDGAVTEELIAFYTARAAGGAALLTMGAVAVGYPQGQVQVSQVGISEDRFLPGLRRLTDAVHRSGSRLCAQLQQGGASAVCDMAAGLPIWVPSLPRPAGAPAKSTLLPDEIAISPAPQVRTMPQYTAMDHNDIALLVEQYADAGARAMAAGFDAIEIHAAHGYIIHSFLSPAENGRADEYGGSPENRARLLREIIGAIRQRIGRDFPIICKLNAAEFFVDGGLTIEDVCTNAQIAEAAGADAIAVTATHNYSYPRALFSSFLPHIPGRLIPHAAAVKAAVSIPVIAVGRIDPDIAEQAVAAGHFDFMAMGRKQIADDAMASHLAGGGAKAVRPCIYCYTCISQPMLQLPLRCAVNADVGFEKDNLLAPADRARNVVVVGGGPAGMEASRRLALRGHKVVLLEASARLGGLAHLAAATYAPNAAFIEWLQREIVRPDISIRLNTRATAATIQALNPDTVIVATGSIPGDRKIPGSDLPHVHDAAALLYLNPASDAATPPSDGDQVTGLAGRQGDRPSLLRGNRVAIIGGDLIGLHLAEYLQERHWQVTVIDQAEQLGTGLSPARRQVMLDAMPLDGIALHADARDICIRENSVRFSGSAGEPVEVAADVVIMAAASKADTSLFEQLRACGLEAHAIGDCQGTRYILGAMRDAADVVARI